MRWAILFVSLLSVDMRQSVSSQDGVGISFSLDQAAFVTVVVDDRKGQRVANLTSERFFKQGTHTVFWDGRDVRHDQPAIVPAGTYRVHGLTHAGIRLRFELAVNSPGNPPWPTRDATGGWLADHTPPADVLFLPKGNACPWSNGDPILLICAPTAETSFCLIWVDQDGRKLHGVRNTAGAVHGFHALLRDVGPEPIADYYAYGQRNTTIVGMRRDGSYVELATRTSGGKRRQDPDAKLAKLRARLKGERLPEPDQFRPYSAAIYNGIVAMPLIDDDALVFLDLRRSHGQELGRVTISSPRGCVFRKDGRLLVLSGTRLLSGQVDFERGRINRWKTLIDVGLDDPRRVIVANEGRICISDHGSSHQVKVFTADGQPIRSIGRPGKPRAGQYDERKMFRPQGMAVDDRGRLWVAESDYHPKRISRWRTTGEFLDAFYGSPRYGAGGFISPSDPTRFFYDEMEFIIDWRTGTSKPLNILSRLLEGSHEGPYADVERLTCRGPQYPIDYGGHHYLINQFNKGRYQNSDIFLWKKESDGIAYPIAYVGKQALNVNKGAIPFFRRPEILDRYGVEQRVHGDVVRMYDKSQTLFWSDLNADHHIQESEFQLADIGMDGGSGFGILSDLSLVSANGFLFKPKVNADGIPIYDTKAGFRLANPPGKTQGHPTMTSDGSFLRFMPTVDYYRPKQRPKWDGVDAPVFEAYQATERRWLYRRFGASDGTGRLNHCCKFLGLPLKIPQGEAGEIIGVLGDKGQAFLMTGDGLFVKTIGRPMGYGRMLRFPNTHRGDLIPDDTTFQDEIFHGGLTLSGDGQVYLVIGKQSSNVFRCEGFESIRRREFGMLELTSSDVAQLESLPPRPVAPFELRRQLQTRCFRKAPVIDGRLDEGVFLKTDTQATTLRITSGVTARVYTTPTHFAACFACPPRMLENGASNIQTIFQGGGGLDVMLGSAPDADPERRQPIEGDIRLFLAMNRGKLRVVLYQAVVPNATPEDRVRFTSPIGEVVFDTVREVTDAVQFAQKGNSFEFAIPLDVLGIQLQPGHTYLLDVGCMQGNGAETLRRLYWSNQHADNVSDVPSEARLQPKQWALWRID